MTIKKNDFIELEYTGKTKAEGAVFDTTDENVAKDAGIHNTGTHYGPVVICVGQHHILPGIDKHLEGKSLGKHTITLTPEEAFGKKNAKLIQLLPTSKFIKEKIMPQPGLQVTVDGHLGTVKTVTGGRTLVDFNHPLSGKEIVYDIDLKNKVEDKKKQVEAILEMRLHLHKVKVEVAENKATIAWHEVLPKPIQEQIDKEIQEATGIKEITWKKEG